MWRWFYSCAILICIVFTGVLVICGVISADRQMQFMIFITSFSAAILSVDCLYEIDELKK